MWFLYKHLYIDPSYVLLFQPKWEGVDGGGGGGGVTRRETRDAH